MLKPYYYQRNEDYEPEFIGFAENWDKALDLIDTNKIYKMSVIDEMNEDMYLNLKNELNEKDIKELDKYYENNN